MQDDRIHNLDEESLFNSRDYAKCNAWLVYFANIDGHSISGNFSEDLLHAQR